MKYFLLILLLLTGCKYERVYTVHKYNDESFACSTDHFDLGFRNRDTLYICKATEIEKCNSFCENKRKEK